MRAVLRQRCLRPGRGNYRSSLPHRSRDAAGCGEDSVCHLVRPQAPREWRRRKRVNRASSDPPERERIGIACCEEMQGGLCSQRSPRRAACQPGPRISSNASEAGDAGRAVLHQRRVHLGGAPQRVTGPEPSFGMESFRVQQRQPCQQHRVQPVALGVLGIVRTQVGGPLRRDQHDEALRAPNHAASGTQALRVGSITTVRSAAVTQYGSLFHRSSRSAALVPNRCPDHKAPRVRRRDLLDAGHGRLCRCPVRRIMFVDSSCLSDGQSPAAVLAVRRSIRTRHSLTGILDPMPARLKSPGS